MELIAFIYIYFVHTISFTERNILLYSKFTSQIAFYVLNSLANRFCLNILVVLFFFFHSMLKKLS